jgi:hypothetical protein
MRKPLIVLALALGLSSCATLARPDPSGATDNDCRQRGDKVQLFGLTADQELICYRENQPEQAKTLGKIAGLAMDTRLVGIDVRPATGDLYGLGDRGGVYIVDQRTGAVTLRSRLNVALSGQSFGVDFNPTVDRLRTVSDTGQNLRTNVDDGTTTVDGGLNNAGAPAAGVAAVAYTNNDADPNTGTTLFDVDTALDQLVIQAPPNAGGLNLVGKLGVDTGPAVAADTFSRIGNGTTASNKLFAALTVNGRSALYTADPLIGRVQLSGYFPEPVIGIAAPTR